MRTHDSPQSATTAPSGITVLLGSDRGACATALVRMLERDGCSVETASSQDELLAIASRPFDAIFLDLEARDLDALALLRQLRSPAAGVQCPVVLIGVADEPEHVVQRGLDLGAAAYVLKDRLPDTASMAQVFESVGIRYADGPSRPPPPDSCPHSSHATFHECAAFMPINALMHRGQGLERVSCSHLRSGTAQAWRLYPRCAIGDATARAKYARDQGS
jgi:CheY-like chemotaxis protein